MSSYNLLGLNKQKTTKTNCLAVRFLIYKANWWSVLTVDSILATGSR
jgi:hypothetical protein